MAGTPRRTYKKSAVTRQTILEAALELMKEKGYRGTTIREICTRAGTAVGSFYSYFDGKTDILRALYADGETYFSTVVRQETAGADTEDFVKFAHLPLDVQRKSDRHRHPVEQDDVHQHDRIDVDAVEQQDQADVDSAQQHQHAQRHEEHIFRHADAVKIPGQRLHGCGTAL